MSTVLIVDDEASICWALERALSEDGHSVTTAATAEEALDFAESACPNVIMMDIRLPGIDGLSALEKLRSRLGATPVIIMTAFGSLETAVQAINRGAFEYLTKPFDLDEAIEVVRRALASPRHSESGPNSGVVEGSLDEAFLGTSPAIQAVFRKIALVAEHDVPVLISGESGTGKELVATAIHRYSRRSSGPFVPICVPAMSESLLESELFGHARGAFTGALFERQGLLGAAHGGTSFFDEIGDISVPTQVKLLRVLETKAIAPVGSNEPHRTDFRLVAATNRSLEEMVAIGSFREDLFYRLNVFRIEIPPLRERRDDIPLLATHFLRHMDARGNAVLSEEALDELSSRPWYGNVRELRNAIEHAVVVTRSGTIGPDCLPPPTTKTLASGQMRPSLRGAVQHWMREAMRHEASTGENEGLYEYLLAEVEPVMLSEALQVSGGNRREAARLLGIHRQTLREKMRRHGLDVPEE